MYDSKPTLQRLRASASLLVYCVQVYVQTFHQDLPNYSVNRIPAVLVIDQYSWLMRFVDSYVLCGPVDICIVIFLSKNSIVIKEQYCHMSLTILFYSYPRLDWIMSIKSISLSSTTVEINEILWAMIVHEINNKDLQGQLFPIVSAFSYCFYIVNSFFPSAIIVFTHVVGWCWGWIKVCCLH